MNVTRMLCGTLLTLGNLASGATRLTTVEAESGALGAEFVSSVLGGATCIAISTTTSAYNPGSTARVATYEVAFPAPNTYHLYARVHVGPASYSDDSFFYGDGFGVKPVGMDSSWVAVVEGLVTTGFTNAGDPVTAGGGAAGIQVWKWVKFNTSFVVGGALSQTFQIGGRENGFSIDKLVFAPSDISLRVAELDSGEIATPPPSITFAGPDGIAIHRFGILANGLTPDGANPASGLVQMGNELQGTTLNGGSLGAGVAFRVSLDGSDFSPLNNFGLAGLAHPHRALLVSGGGYYGMSQTGGANGTGAVFQRKTDGTFASIRSFNSLAPHTATNVGGANPSGALALSASMIYGVSSAGGAGGGGTVFAITTSGSGFTVLRDFSAINVSDGVNATGAIPIGGVTLDGGKLYGTASSGGEGGTGVIFSIDPNGGNFAVLHHFSSLDFMTAVNADGACPHGELVASQGILYGTALAGGAGGNGTIFAINMDGTDFLTLYSFTATDPLLKTNADGASPAAGLALSGNVFYGTTSGGEGELRAPFSHWTRLFPISGHCIASHPLQLVELMNTARFPCLRSYVWEMHCSAQHLPVDLAGQVVFFEFLSEVVPACSPREIRMACLTLSSSAGVPQIQVTSSKCRIF